MKPILVSHCFPTPFKPLALAKKIISIATALLLVVVAKAQNPPAFIKDSLDAYVNRSLAEWQVPGAAVCIVKDGKVVMMKGYGMKELGGHDPVDENTLFMIGSNSKAFTATALAMLDAEKKISLNDRVTKWIPEFRLQNRLAGEQAIVRDLLCHRIGFQTFQGDFTYWTSNLSRSEVIEKMGHVKAVHDFRTTWGYTNAAFLTAGQIIPKVTAQPWEDLVKQKIFDPLGMTRTLALSRDLPSANNKCAPHTLVNGHIAKIPYCLIDNLAPAGSISSSVNDMSKWVIMQLGNGMYEGKEIIPAAAIAQTRQPQSILGNGGAPFNTSHFLLYGLGWFLQEYSGKEIVWHTGGVNGFVSSVTLVPEEKLGIIVFTNTDNNTFYEALKWEILDAYLGNKYRDYSSIFLKNHRAQEAALFSERKKMDDSVALHLPAALPLQAYAGNYYNDLYGNMNIGVEQGGLVMHFSHHPGMAARLSALGGNRFFCVFSDPEFGTAVFPFAVENGKVKSVHVKVADFVEYTPYDFVKK